MVKLRPWIVLVLFVVGAAAGLVGDHSHVVTGTTEYLPPSHAVPFVWSSPIWFAVMVGAGTAILAELRLHLPAVRSAVTVRQGRPVSPPCWAAMSSPRCCIPRRRFRSRR